MHPQALHSSRLDVKRDTAYANALMSKSGRQRVVKGSTGQVQGQGQGQGHGGALRVRHREELLRPGYTSETGWTLTYADDAGAASASISDHIDHGGSHRAVPGVHKIQAPPTTCDADALRQKLRS